MTKDLKTRAEAHAHSYPFQKVNDAYIAGANEERKLLTEWHDASKELPPDDREVLCMIHRKYQTYAILIYDGKFWWQPIAPATALQDGGWIGFYEDVIAWREIHENE